MICVLLYNIPTSAAVENRGAGAERQLSRPGATCQISLNVFQSYQELVHHLSFCRSITNLTQYGILFYLPDYSSKII